MKKIVIHVEPSGGLGGAQVYAAILAESFDSAGEVTLVHHTPGLTHSSLSEFSGCSLAKVQVLAKPARRHVPDEFQSPLHYFAAQRRYGRALSKNADVFITVTHDLPVYCAASTGVLVSLFPIFAPREAWPFLSKDDSLRSRFTGAAWKVAWRSHFKGYRRRIAISEYSAKWTLERWGIPCDVIYPPVGGELRSGTKENLIVTVGRFSGGAVSKHQIELLDIFKRVKAKEPAWDFVCVGSADESAAGRDYLNAAITRSKESGARVVVAAPRPVIEDYLSRARILWHAAGLADNADMYPERAEHFGIAIAEAMSCGCVPVIFDGGGQREIIEHGVSGFLCKSSEDFERRTLELLRNPELLNRMSAAATQRSRRYSVDSFRRNFCSAVPELSYG